MKRLLVLAAAAAAFATMPASADIANGLPTFNWIQPATWTDGAPLSASQITGYQLVCTGAASVNRRITAAAGVPPSVTPTTNRFSPGAYQCTLAVYARRTAADPEILGGASNPVSFTVPQPAPGVVTGLSVE